MPATSAGMTGKSAIARSEATKQSRLAASALDCFASLAMTTNKKAPQQNRGAFDF